MNSNNLTAENDPGRDGEDMSANHAVARDVFGFSLHYFDGDYTGTVSGNGGFLADQTGSDLESNSADLYNGNIGRMVTTITDPTSRHILPLGNVYQYDQLNRLMVSNSFLSLDQDHNQWLSDNAPIYRNQFTYDANGNILTQYREDDHAQTIDDLTYAYPQVSGKTVRNRLTHVTDNVNSGNYADDIDTQASTNYQYDGEGRLVKDIQEEIDQIVWRVDGKVKKIIRPSNSTKKNVSFDYDAMGHRIAKHVMNAQNQLEKSTYYVLDAQGNAMSVYEREVDNTSESISYVQAEKHIYGSSRLGVMNDSIPLLGSQNSTYSQATWTHTIGNRTYELSNHLGNVLSVISDKVIPHDNGGTVDYFLADIRQSTDYSPFGAPLPGRQFNSSNYRFGYNGMELDNETKGNGNSYTSFYRQYDPRLGKWLSIDPKAGDHPEITPYHSMSNNPIARVDPKGDDDYFINTKTGEIQVMKTDCTYDTFSVGEDNDGAFGQILKLEKNEYGLVNFPSEFSGLGATRYGGVQDAGTVTGTKKGKTFTEEVGSGDHYLKPETAAGLVGLLYVAHREGMSISMGDMSTSNGSDPATPTFHHGGHGHMGKRSGLDIDFRYIGNNGSSAQGVMSDPSFSQDKNQRFYELAFMFGFDKKNTYQGPSGTLKGVKKMEGHDNHGHLGMDTKPKNIKIIGHTQEGYECTEEPVEQEPIKEEECE